VHYQPLVGLETGEVRALEALMRWPHPERGMIPPSEFIPVAEETGLIAQLGLFVLRRACADAALWPDGVKVAVNLSPMQFKNGTLLQSVRDALGDAGLRRRGWSWRSRDAAARQERTRDGHAARAPCTWRSHFDGRFRHRLFVMSYLRSFPFDKIKIDRSFVHDIGCQHGFTGHRARDRQPRRQPRDQDHRRGHRDRKRSAYLKAEGCTEGQGFLFSKALPQSEILALLAKQKSKRAA